MTGRIHLIAAARPNFMKVAPLWHALVAAPGFTPVVVHTGQHYDAAMSDDIFTDLQMGAPDHHLGVGSGSHAEQTGRVMIAYEALLATDRPDAIVVVGDVNSTAGCTIVGVKAGIPVIHLEAGLRSGDRRMPEEINRLVTDAIADVLWTPSPDGDANLLHEGVDPARITRVGNIMLDSYELIRPTITAAATPAEFGLTPGGYGVVTLHRPSNVDDLERLAEVVDALLAVQQRLPLVFPVHPRTRQRLEASGLDARLADGGVRLEGPLPYARFMSLVEGAAATITDSGGIQEETTYLAIPCLTLRDNTERPITISEGTNRLVTPATLAAELATALTEPRSARRRPDLWDGATAGRCRWSQPRACTSASPTAARCSTALLPGGRQPMAIVTRISSRRSGSSSSGCRMS
jgi:UDP-N-acetylglucosamine 2-epimerase (non-hydrolysing)